LTLAIGGNPQGDRWMEFALRAGTDVDDVLGFLITIMNDLHERRTFICNNLRPHYSPMVRHLIQDNGHRIVYRTPYYPRDGPVEYVFQPTAT